VDAAVNPGGHAGWRSSQRRVCAAVNPGIQAGGVSLFSTGGNNWGNWIVYTVVSVLLIQPGKLVELGGTGCGRRLGWVKWWRLAAGGASVWCKDA
jgi:hypothetical protein